MFYCFADNFCVRKIFYECNCGILMERVSEFLNFTCGSELDFMFTCFIIECRNYETLLRY